MKLYKEGYLFKPLLRNSKNYKKYYNSLDTTFKFPKLNKSQSDNYLNITRKKVNNDDYKDNDNDNDNQMSKINKINISRNYFYNRILNHKIKNNSTIRNQLICKDMFYKNNSSLVFNFRNNIKKIKIKSRSYISINDKSNMSCIINFFNDYEKEFFPDIDYSNLKYNDYEIYKDKSVYENLIKNKVKYFKNNKNLNPTIKFQKNFFYGKFKKEIDLTFNSLKITFHDMAELKDNNNNNKFEFFLPFALLPVFYFKGFESFMKFLSVVIKVENNFEKIIFEEDKISDALNDIKDFKIKNDIEKVNTFEYELKSIFKKSLKKEMPKQIRPLILKREKNFLKYNNFSFFWITNTKTFIVTITLPTLDLHIIENKILIHHFIDFEFLFYLYKRNFLNWEYFVIRNLSGYSKFRNVFQKLGSCVNLSSQKIYLKEPKSFQNNFGEEVLYNVYTDQFNKNQIIQFRSFNVIVNLIDLNYKLEKTYQINFNFFHFIKLYEIAKYSSKIIFLFKFLEINSETNALSFNFKEFDEFDIKDWMDNIKKFSFESLQRRNHIEKLYREFEFFAKKIKIEFIRPKWSIIKLENHNEIMKTWEIGEDLEKDLVDSINYPNSNCWTNFLNGCLKKLNEPVPILPEINLRKKLRKRGYSGIFNSSSSDRSRKSKSRSSKALI